MCRPDPFLGYVEILPQGSYQPWKSLNLKFHIARPDISPEKGLGPGKILKI